MDIESLIKKHRLASPIYVTRPRMPEKDRYCQYLDSIWDSRWLTNDGQYHKEFQEKLNLYLETENLNLFVNGTIALLVALQALRINSGEVITTPFTFPASTHVLYWNKVTPVFCDIDPETYNIDPNLIEKLIKPDTKAILAVHVYGIPCDVEAIKSIADRHGLFVIYDAAHGFGVRINDEPIVNFGDISALSFHATKLFSSIEGGALISHSQKMYDRIRFLKNFGIADEETVIGPGINGKMNEFQAAFGLLQLEDVDNEISNRKKLTESYRNHLAGIKGIRLPEDKPGVRHNYAYFPVLFDPDIYKINRDQVYDILKKCNIHTRKYFYPLCSNYPCYSALPSAAADNLPVANRTANQVLCLPLYGDMPEEVTISIAEILKSI